LSSSTTARESPRRWIGTRAQPLRRARWLLPSSTLQRCLDRRWHGLGGEKKSSIVAWAWATGDGPRQSSSVRPGMSS
jgi:hypothetical protein